MTERMKGQLVLALCTSLILVLEHRLHAREKDEASGGGKHSHTHNLLAMYISILYVMQLHTNRSARDNTSNNKAHVQVSRELADWLAS